MKKYIRIKDVAKQLSIGQSTLFDWINPKSPRFKEDFPKPIRIGRCTFFSQSEINSYLANLQ